MSSFDISEVRDDLRHGAHRRPQARRYRFAGPHPLLAHLSATSALAPVFGCLHCRPDQPDRNADVEECFLLSSTTEARQYSLDVAEQRNAEDSPSGIARQHRLGLTG
ncbi:hypothetical protein DM872_01475 [Pseudomonas taiwanensis]|uniref:hypothetical protein n=1 Tax=Pseudomonas taiwanensis TaxID=470150 RepID=UPI0015BCFE66|nr:hypothetical protein [Pseudomonas taiwanensis]NWL75527.1 hypothetical protein [Pseudomonas taiwanensis]